jgi:hypothetical protein
MQHRHFATIAAIIAHLPEGRFMRDDVAVKFADELKSTNSNFDYTRFLRAAGAL